MTDHSRFSQLLVVGIATFASCARPSGEAPPPSVLEGDLDEVREVALRSRTINAGREETVGDTRADASKKQGSALERVWADLSGHNRQMVERAQDYRLQVALSVFDDAGRVSHDKFRLGDEYLYPASAIKIFASAGILLWLQDKRREVESLGLDAEIMACPEGNGACEVIVDNSNRDGHTLTLGHVLLKMHLVSDNKAFNMLYDLVGHEELNQRFWDLGYTSLRVHHRMFSNGDAKEQRVTPRIQLRTTTGAIVEIPRRESDLALPATPASGLRVGTAHRAKSGRRHEEPMDFSQKNFVSVADLHRLILAVNAPGKDSRAALPLDDDLRSFLRMATTTLPHHSSNPRYPHLREGWGRFKPLCRGVLHVGEDGGPSCSNKAGNAYGFLLDNVYMRSETTGDAVAVTVGMYVNPNGVINDDEYSYDEEGRPLLRAMGVAIAQHHLDSGIR